jgi:hypothetical protein
MKTYATAEWKLNEHGQCVTFVTEYIRAASWSEAEKMTEYPKYVYGEMVAEVTLDGIVINYDNEN